MSAEEVELRTVWRDVVGVDATSVERFEALAGRHREPHRRYHTLRHVAWVVRHVDALRAHEPVVDAGAVLVAACYHDAVYDPTASDNEAASGRLARRDLTELGWPDERVDRVVAMIEATAHHGHDPADLDDLAVDTAVLLDADLAVLAAPPSAYQAYATGVRAEYGHVDDASWRTGRRAVLDAMLARRALYVTPTGARWWEARARANVGAEVAALRGT